jgi:hypothetical protein
MSYHKTILNKYLYRVRASGDPCEVSDVYINSLDGGLPELKEMVNTYGLMCKWDKTTGRYVIEKPAPAIRARGEA